MANKNNEVPSIDNTPTSVNTPSPNIFQSIDFTMTEPKSNRKFRLIGTQKANAYPNKKVPILFLFHGGGETADEIVEYTGFSQINAYVIAPYGQVSLNKYSWENAFPWLSNPPQSDVTFVQDILNYLQTNVTFDMPIDFDRIYASGKSDGAGFALYLANFYSSIIPIKAVAICSGAYFCLNNESNYGNTQNINLKKNTKIPLLEMHGTEDSVMPYTGQSFQNTLAKQYCSNSNSYWNKIDPNCNNTYTANIYNYWKYWGNNKEPNISSINGQQLFIWNNNIHIQIANGDHDWSGHLNSGPKSNSTNNLSFDATLVISKFLNLDYSSYNTTITTAVSAIPYYTQLGSNSFLSRYLIPICISGAIFIIIIIIIIVLCVYLTKK